MGSSVFAAVTGFVMAIILLVLGLSRLEIAPFTESEVISNLSEWRSLAEIKELIELTKDGKHISGHDLLHELKKLECEKKVVCKIFHLNQEQSKKLHSKFVVKYKLV